MITEIRKKWHIWRARKAYYRYRSICSDYQVVGILTRNMDPVAIKQASIFNQSMSILHRLDPSIPLVKL